MRQVRRAWPPHRRATESERATAEREPDGQGLALNGNLSLNPRQVLNVHRARQGVPHLLERVCSSLLILKDEADAWLPVAVIKIEPNTGGVVSASDALNVAKPVFHAISFDFSAPSALPTYRRGAQTYLSAAAMRGTKRR